MRDEVAGVLIIEPRGDRFEVTYEPTVVIAALMPLEFGDLPGHAFRGNQWTGGQGES